MGNMCGCGTDAAAKTATVNMLKPRLVANQPSSHNDNAEWRKIMLSRKVQIFNVHPHVLHQFKNKNDPIPESARKQLKSDGDQPAEKEGSDDDSYYYEDDGKWLCNGTVCFIDGCKSG